MYKDKNYRDKGCIDKEIQEFRRSDKGFRDKELGVQGGGGQGVQQQRLGGQEVGVEDGIGMVIQVGITFREEGAREEETA